MNDVRVRSLVRADVPTWQRFRRALWPDISDAANNQDCETIVNDSNRFAVFISESKNGLTGFIEASLRQYADGCDTSPVGYLEGWYVEPESRRRGIGRLLVTAAEQWARSKGCTEMASGALLDNMDGQRAHERLGYVEVERQVCFRKDLRAQ